MAAQHDRDAIGHGHRLGLVVRDVDEGGAEPAVQLGDLARASARAAWRRDCDSGSSIRNACGWRTMARASATRWRWPPESWPGGAQQMRRSPALRRLPARRRRSRRASRLPPARGARPAAAAARRQPPHHQRQRDVLGAPSCTDRARRTGTPWRRRARLGGRSRRRPRRRCAPRRLSCVLETGDDAQQRATCRSRTGPTSVRNSPSATSRSMPERTGGPPKDLLIWVNSTAASYVAPLGVPQLAAGCIWAQRQAYDI